MNNICVVGSINMDYVIMLDEIPKMGETLQAHNFIKVPGGKGANQAIAARRLGGSVSMIGCVGNDENGRVLLDNLKKEGINIQCVKTDECSPTGLAFIMVDKSGSNIIAVYPGANDSLSPEDVKLNKEIIASSDILVAQFETPLKATFEAFKIAHENNIITILNPAPAKDIPDELFQYCDIVIPNESEAEKITGISPINTQNIKKIGAYFENKGVRFTIITLGDKGAALVGNEKVAVMDALKVNAVDSTAAGDSFIGGIAWYLSNNKELNFDNLSRAIKFANKVAAITVTREGAQSSIPFLKEVIEIFGGEEL